MKIDYTNLKRYFDILVIDADKPLQYSLVDKNRERLNKTKETDAEATIINLIRPENVGIHDHFCEWWRHTQNRETVKQWFLEKYNK